MSRAFRIKNVRVWIVSKSSKGGDYFNQGDGEHWLVDSLISNPMSGYADYREKRTSWGIGVLGSIVVEIEADDGTVGVATGTGGFPAGWLIENHFSRFLVGQDARNTNLIWDQMYRASLPYGRKGITVMAISAVDLALWDLLGKIRSEPVYNLIGGLTRDEISFYCTGPDASAIKGMGFWGAKVPLPHSPTDGDEGLASNVAYLRAHREAIGPDFPLMVDCYMSLNVPYAIELAEACKDINIYWWEEVLSPEDVEGYRRIRQAHPKLKWTTGEHEYTRYGFRSLIEERLIDVLQPDVMWVGGLTELLKIAGHASTLDIPIIPHGSGPYSYHFIASQTSAPLCEYVATSRDGRTILPVFGDLFEGEDVPENGKLTLSHAPGFGMNIRDREVLKPLRH
ncbi:L-rhamnonate dehydratase [Boseongicola aestuarii]|uniref:L-rhamnonate dehydratase n=1 Tax=Boseongicola aestuarii TaxID=1470561 RepID=A0A238J0Z0_9RHOB|nr:L-rhamnonate dehydratase [Boseongicola aestuarii]SMX23983.1 L-rhamnonate dehydratase [Boseongicola aestuarii]